MLHDEHTLPKGYAYHFSIPCIQNSLQALKNSNNVQITSPSVGDSYIPQGGKLEVKVNFPWK